MTIRDRRTAVVNKRMGIIALPPPTSPQKRCKNPKCRCKCHQEDHLHHQFKCSHHIMTRRSVIMFILDMKHLWSKPVECCYCRPQSIIAYKTTKCVNTYNESLTNYRRVRFCKHVDSPHHETHAPTKGGAHFFVPEYPCNRKRTNAANPIPMAPEKLSDPLPKAREVPNAHANTIEPVCMTITIIHKRRKDFIKG